MLGRQSAVKMFASLLILHCAAQGCEKGAVGTLRCSVGVNCAILCMPKSVLRSWWTTRLCHITRYHHRSHVTL
jgi:hypothetical protein